MSKKDKKLGEGEESAAADEAAENTSSEVETVASDLSSERVTDADGEDRIVTTLPDGSVSKSIL